MQAQNTSCFVGIDLGTTYSCIAVYRDGRVEIIANENGNRTTPSYVAFDGDDRFIGDAAKAQLTHNAQNTVFDAKRLIGRKYNDATVQDDISHYPFAVVAGGPSSDVCDALIEVTCLGERKQFRPEEISAMILHYLKRSAELFLGCDVRDVVITVPAYFNDAQRRATALAGEIAGMRVIKIINEPTAAALAYNLQSVAIRTSSVDNYVLVYDLGGGTLDVTILHMVDGFLEVKATRGDTHLGGEDFDNKLATYCLLQCMRKIYKPKTLLSVDETRVLCELCGVRTIDELIRLKLHVLHEYALNAESERQRRYLAETEQMMEIVAVKSSDSRLLSRLKKACEDAKKVLSVSDNVTVRVDSFHFDNDASKMHDLSVPVSRVLFERLCNDVFLRCLDPVNDAIADSGVNASVITDIVLVGGSTRIPKIRQMLIEKFGNSRIRSDINPDEAVAYGAAVQAAMCHDALSGASRDLVLTDVVPLSLGIETSGGLMTVIIRRGTTIPCKAERVFTTYSDNQPAVTVKAYEGEREIACENNLLGNFELDGIAPASKGEPRIKVTFEVDGNGIMSVSAAEESSGKQAAMTVRNDHNRLSGDEIARMINDAQTFAERDRDARSCVEARMKLEQYVTSVNRTVCDEAFKTMMGDDVVAFIADRIAHVTNWLSDNDTATKSEYDDMHSRLEEEFAPPMEMYVEKKRFVTDA